MPINRFFARRIHSMLSTKLAARGFRLGETCEVFRASMNSILKLGFVDRRSGGYVTRRSFCRDSASSELGEHVTGVGCGLGRHGGAAVAATR